MTCPVCGSEAYVGFKHVECSNPSCVHYSASATIGPNGVLIEIAAKKFLAKVDIQAASAMDPGFLDRFQARIRAISCSDGRKYAEQVCKIYRQETNPRGFCSCCGAERQEDGSIAHSHECIVNYPADFVGP